jgi:hypothetical protein
MSELTERLRRIAEKNRNARHEYQILDTSDELDEAADEIERLQSIVDRLPKDALRNPVAPGAILASTFGSSVQEPREVVEVRKGGWRFGNSNWYHEGDPTRLCYPTTEDAERAVA